ncbi:hypothetical protein OFB74_30845, partial [Escherichia coli]|nr:hypothetical protein [Escherichia coli]
AFTLKTKTYHSINPAEVVFVYVDSDEEPELAESNDFQTKKRKRMETHFHAEKKARTSFDLRVEMKRGEREAFRREWPNLLIPAHRNVYYYLR